MTDDQSPKNVYFYNKEAIDLEFIRLLGVSVKVTENPFGFFGTGLKFSIATLLRNGLGITMIVDGKMHIFDTITKEIRGHDFESVRMDGDELGFTTELGKHWEIWEAYRELHSNTLDEGGVILDETPEHHNDFGTQIIVTGDAFYAEGFLHRHEIFLASDPFETLCEVEFHDRDEVGKHGFYRGVRALELNTGSLYNYNVLRRMEITEDRTIKNAFMFQHVVTRAIAALDDFETLENILLARDYWEGDLDFTAHTEEVSDAFLAVCDQHSKKDALNSSALKIWKARQPPKVVINRTETLESFEDKMKTAFGILAAIGQRITADDFVVVESLPYGKQADIIDGMVVINKIVFELEPREIAMIIYKRWVCTENEVALYTFEHFDHVIETLFDSAMVVRKAIDGRKAPKVGAL